MSDVLPHRSAPLIVAEPLEETVAEETVLQTEETAGGASRMVTAPAIFVVSEASKVNVDALRSAPDEPLVSQAGLSSPKVMEKSAIDVQPAAAPVDVPLAIVNAENIDPESERSSTETIVAPTSGPAATETISNHVAVEESAVVDVPKVSSSSSRESEVVITHLPLPSESKEPSEGQHGAADEFVQAPAARHDDKSDTLETTPILEAKAVSPAIKGSDSVSTPPSSIQLSLNTDTETLPAVGEASGSSESLHTPSDTMSFRTAESDEEKEVEVVADIVIASESSCLIC